MASPPSSSSSFSVHPSDDSSTEIQKRMVANKLLSNALLLSSSSPSIIHHAPLLLHNQSSISKLNVNGHIHVPVAARLLIRDLHNSMVSTADRCLGLVLSFASRSPILTTLLSLPSHFRRFSQIQQKNYRNFSGLSNHNFGAILPGDSVAGTVVTNGILNFLEIYNTLLVVRLVLTWFPNSPPAIVSPLSTVCDPYLNIFRGVIPPLGGTLDLSPILAFIVLNAVTSAASALPAELPSTGTSQEFPPSNRDTPHHKWRRTPNGSRRKSSGGGL